MLIIAYPDPFIKSQTDNLLTYFKSAFGYFDNEVGVILISV